MGIGKRIREARESKNWTQNQLADMIGVTPSSITNYEKETSHPKEPILYRLIEVLEVDANFLFQDNVPSATPANLLLQEKELLQKYRVLDSHGQQTVNTIVNLEYSRCTAAPKPAPDNSHAAKQRQQWEEKPHLMPIAAHNEHEHEPEEQARMQRDIEKLKKLRGK